MGLSMQTQYYWYGCSINKTFPSMMSDRLLEFGRLNERTANLRRMNCV
jgi:hypothetical protein